MVEDMAVIHRFTRRGAERNADAHRFIAVYQHRIFPDPVGFRLSVTAHHLKRVVVQVKRMTHAARIDAIGFGPQYHQRE